MVNKEIWKRLIFYDINLELGFLKRGKKKELLFFINLGMKAKWFRVLLRKESDRTLLHSIPWYIG